MMNSDTIESSRNVRLTVVSLGVLIFVCTAIVGYKLLWSVTPYFMFQEAYGLAYNHAPELGALCSPDAKAGLEITSNVTDQRSSSYFYALLNKTVFSDSDLYSAHRLIAIVLYGGALAFFASSLWLMGIRGGLIFLFITLFSFNPQFISLLFESKLTLLSMAWLSVVFYTAAYIDRGSCRVLVFLFTPWLLAFSYEAYAVSRPLAAVFECVLFAYLTAAVVLGRKRSEWGVFVISSILAWQALRFVHPAVGLNGLLFEGRSESIISQRGLFIYDAEGAVYARLGELWRLLDWSQKKFSAETLDEVGCAEYLIALLSLVIPILFSIFISARVRSELKRYAREHSHALIALMITLIVSLVIPLCSTTYVRGHRLYGFYAALIIFIILGAELMLRIFHRRVLASIFGLFFSIMVLIDCTRRLEGVYRWAPDTKFTRPQIAELLDTVSQFKSEAGKYSSNGMPRRGFFCDASDSPIWEHDWNAAFYVTKTGCEFKMRSLTEHCPCADLARAEGGYCFTRSGSKNSGYLLNLQYGEIDVQRAITFYSSREYPSPLAIVNVQRELAADKRS